jgi:hypothetical protein
MPPARFRPRVQKPRIAKYTRPLRRYGVSKSKGPGAAKKASKRPKDLKQQGYDIYRASERATYAPEQPRRNPFGVFKSVGPGAAKKASWMGAKDYSQYLASERATYKRTYPQTGPKYVDPKLMAKVMASEPKDSSGAFEQHNFYQGEDFVNYLYEQGIVPHWGNVQSPSGNWIGYLLGKMGIYSYGVNPFGKPYQQQQQQPAGYGGGYGYTPKPYTPAPYVEPEPKQYGSIRDRSGRNLPDWLKEMVVWNI